MLTKKIILPVVGIVLVGGVALGAGSVYAQSTTTSPLTTLSQEIAQKFNLNPTDVQSAVADWRMKKKSVMSQHMQDRLTVKLDQAVKDKKITASQKQAILDKFTQLKNASSRSNFKSMTPDERKAYREKSKADLDAWAKTQGINLSDLPQIFMEGSRGFMHAVK